MITTGWRRNEDKRLKRGFGKKQKQKSGYRVRVIKCENEEKVGCTGNERSKEKCEPRDQMGTCILLLFVLSGVRFVL